MINNCTIQASEPEPTVPSQDVPFATEFIRVSHQEMMQLGAECNRYKSIHQRALLKIKALEKVLALEKGGTVRDLNHRLTRVERQKRENGGKGDIKA